MPCNLLWPKLLRCMARLRHRTSDANSARNRSSGSRSAQECGRDIVGRYTHRCFQIAFALSSELVFLEHSNPHERRNKAKYHQTIVH
jgi:hypothetical protein